MPLTDPHAVTVEPPPEDTQQSHPRTYLKIEFDADTRRTLEAWLHLHLSQITTQMQPILSRIQQDLDQMAGHMPGGDYPYEGAFRVNYPLTKRKVREIANRVKQAYLDSDPVWGINLDDPALFELATQIEKALDTAIDHELDEEDDLSLWIVDAVRHGTGCLVPGWVFHEERVRQLRTYEGYDEQQLATLADLVQFEADYPNWRDEPDLVTLHTQLRQGRRVTREIEATVAVANHPDFQHVELDHVRVYPSVKGYEGLRTTPAYGFLRDFTRFELEDLARQDVIDEDAVGRLFPERAREDDANPQDEQEEFTVWVATIRYQLPGDAAPSRYKVWYEVSQQVVLRARHYPWWYFEGDLIPLYSRLEAPGFFKPGIAADVVDEHTVLNVLLNLYLNGADMANSLRLKAKYKSLAYAYIASRQWSPHLPTPWKDDPNEVESMATPTNHLPAIVTGLELMRRQGDEASGTSSLQSGRESPTDPSAPGIKTIALLQQVEPNEKDVLRSMAPGFRQVGVWTMWLYFQALQLDWIDSLPGGLKLDPRLLPMLAEHLHPRALLYEFDRQGRFERNVGLLTLTQRILANSRPDVIMKMLRITISQTDSQWGRLVDTLDLERPMPLPAAPTMPQGPTAGMNGTPRRATTSPDELAQRFQTLGVG